MLVLRKTATIATTEPLQLENLAGGSAPRRPTHLKFSGPYELSSHGVDMLADMYKHRSDTPTIQHIRFATRRPPSSSAQARLAHHVISWSHEREYPIAKSMMIKSMKSPEAEESLGEHIEHNVKNISIPKDSPNAEVTKQPGEMHSSEMLPESHHDAYTHGPYRGGPEAGGISSRTNPNTEYPDVKVGSWMRDDVVTGKYGHFIHQLREIDPKSAQPSEEMHPGKRADVQRYAEWMKQGHRAPPIMALEMDNGAGIRIVDGHRRAKAAELAGKPLRAWVNPAAHSGLTDVGGKPMEVGLTHELAVHQRLMQGHPVPSNVREEYEASPAHEAINRQLPLRKSLIQRFKDWVLGKPAEVEADPLDKAIAPWPIKGYAANTTQMRTHLVNFHGFSDAAVHGLSNREVLLAHKGDHGLYEAAASKKGANVDFQGKPPHHHGELVAGKPTVIKPEDYPSLVGAPAQLGGPASIRKHLVLSKAGRDDWGGDDWYGHGYGHGFRAARRGAPKKVPAMHLAAVPSGHIRDYREGFNEGHDEGRSVNRQERLDERASGPDYSSMRKSNPGARPPRLPKMESREEMRDHMSGTHLFAPEGIAAETLATVHERLHNGGLGINHTHSTLPGWLYGQTLGKSISGAWMVTRDEFRDHHIPSDGPHDGSRHPADIAQLRADMPTLHGYRDSDDAVKDWLGKGHNTRYDMSHLAPKVKRNEKIHVYRATDREDEIFPGAYVTPSRHYAEDHAVNTSMKNPRIISREAYPHQLLPVNPNEFFYAPADIDRHHAESVAAAVKAGKPVPPHVLADYPRLR